MITAILLFIIAGLAEIGGGYLVWLWLRESRPFWYGLVGAVILVGYGIIPTLQKFLPSEEYTQHMAECSSCWLCCGAGL